MSEISLIMRPRLVRVLGLLALSEKRGTSIPETAVAEAAIEVNDPDEAQLIIEAAIALDPGLTYTVGLKALAQTDERLREAALQALADLEATQANEHIAPTERAFTWLTGKKL